LGKASLTLGQEKKVERFLDSLGGSVTNAKEDWLIDRACELMANGLSKHDAKRRALEDWHETQEKTTKPMDDGCHH
jgi:hypothetical protein